MLHILYNSLESLIYKAWIFYVWLQRLVVCLEDRIRIYDIISMKLIHIISCIPENCLIAVGETGRLAYTWDDCTKVRIFNINEMVS